MKRWKLIGLAAIFIMASSLCCGLGVKSANAVLTIRTVESQITLNNSAQTSPDVYQYGLNHFAVVWQDNRNGNWDIYMFYQNYLGDGNWDVQWDTQITSNSGNNLYPKIYDDTIVYQSDRNGNWDIYMYNLTSKVETQITTNTANQGPCEIYGDIIVWQDWRNTVITQYLLTYPGMAIYMYNLTSHTEELLPLPQQACFSPAISGDLVVYIAENYVKNGYTGITDYYPYVCAYNLSSGLSFIVDSGEWDVVPSLSSLTRTMSSPGFDGSICAWTDYSRPFYSRDPREWHILAKNVTSGVTWISGSVQGPYYPDVSGNYVAYQGIASGNWDIYLYDFTSNSPYQVTNNAASQQNPAISTTKDAANMIVYEDNRNGNWDIYLTSFWFSVMGGGSSVPITPSRVIGNLQETKSRIVETPMSGFAGANNKVKENRKNVMIHQLDSAIANVEAAVNIQNLNVRKTNLQCTINQLKSLINKVDGWSLRESADTPGSRFTPDWITAPVFLDQMIRSCQNDLQMLLNGIT